MTTKVKPTQGTSEFTQIAAEAAGTKKNFYEEKKVGFAHVVSICPTMEQIPDDPSNQFEQHQITFNKKYISEGNNLEEAIKQLPHLDPRSTSS